MAIRRMEPLAHTLAGACLAESGLKRLSPLASSTLVIAANIPDVDGACYLHSADLAFAFRRGWTHGILAMALLPLVLTASNYAFAVLVVTIASSLSALVVLRKLSHLNLIGVLKAPE